MCSTTSTTKPTARLDAPDPSPVEIGEEPADQAPVFPVSAVGLVTVTSPSPSRLAVVGLNTQRVASPRSITTLSSSDATLSADVVVGRVLSILEFRGRIDVDPQHQKCRSHLLPSEFLGP